MEIRNNYPQQNFGAIYILTTKIKKKIPFTPFYRRVEADFVRLDRRYDIPAVQEYIAREPNCDRTKELLINLRFPDDPENYRAYALTRQRTNHRNLKANKIVGFCDGNYKTAWKDGKIFFIENLETKSINNKDNVPDRKKVSFLGMNFLIKEKIKDVGKALLRCVVCVQDTDVNAIQLKSLSETSDRFYAHMGFEDYSKHLRWGWRLPRKDFDKLLDRR